MVWASAIGRAVGPGFRSGKRWLCWAALALPWGSTLGAQDNPMESAEPVPTFHAYTNLVQVPVLVLNNDRRQVAPIAENRFYVSLDGGPKFRVTHARLEGDDPISLAILLDVSQPFPTLMREMDDAVAALAPGSLHAKDHVSVYAMDCRLVRSSGYAPAAPETLKRSVDLALEAWMARGQGRLKTGCEAGWNLWDALMSITKGLADQPGRRVVLVATDGVDRGSRFAPNDVRTFAQSKAVAIFGLMQPGDAAMNLQRGSAHAEAIFDSICQLTGGLILMGDQRGLAKQLQWFTTLLRGRYIVEFPRPVNPVGGQIGMDITIDRVSGYIRPAGVGVPLEDPEISKDPTTIPSDPANAPQLGKRKALTPQ